jgi:hypothetical protein
MGGYRSCCFGVRLGLEAIDIEKATFWVNASKLNLLALQIMLSFLVLSAVIKTLYKTNLQEKQSAPYSWFDNQAH